MTEQAFFKWMLRRKWRVQPYSDLTLQAFKARIQTLQGIEILTKGRLAIGTKKKSKYRIFMSLFCESGPVAITACLTIGLLSRRKKYDEIGLAKIPKTQQPIIIQWMSRCPALMNKLTQFALTGNPTAQYLLKRIQLDKSQTS